MKVIVLISGKRKSGKNFFANNLARLLPKDSYALMAFADVAKLRVAQTYGLDYQRLLHDNDYKEEHRQTLIAYAEAKKTFHGEHVWAEEILTQINDSRATYMIVTDWRFNVELEYLKAHCEWPIITVRISVPLQKWMRRGAIYQQTVDEHPSETELDDFVFDLECSSDAGDALLLKKILDILKPVFERRQHARDLESCKSNGAASLERRQANHPTEPVNHTG
jgi:phosphomevalonate kinase